MMYRRFLIDNNPYYRSLFGESHKFWRFADDNLEVVNLGSNTGLYGFRYAGLGMRAANWALGPQSLNQDLAILRNFSEKIGPRGTILVPLCPYSSCLKSYTDTEILKYYTILKPEFIENYSKDISARAHHLKDSPYRYATRNMMTGAIRMGISLMKRKRSRLLLDYQPLNEKEIEQDAQHYIDGWMHQFGVADMDAPVSEQNRKGRAVRVSTLREIMQFCQNKGFRAYVILPPVTKALSSQMSKGFRDNYIYSFIKEAGVSDGIFLDYFESEDFTDPSLYVNSMFLNAKGGLMFTKRVLSDIGVI